MASNDSARYQLSRKQGWNAFVSSGPRDDFEVLTRQQMGALPADHLEDYNEARMVWNANLPTVKTAQLAAAYGVIDQVMASGRRDGDRLRGSVVIDAEPGLGKTTIATRYARDFHRTVYRRDALAVDCVTSCQTRLIIIDDLHFIDFRHRHGTEVSNHLKGLANEMAVTFIYVGVKLQEKRFFDEGLIGEQAVYAQTSRRTTRCEVAPFAIKSEAGFRGWVGLLRALESHIKLVDAHPGMLVDHAQELHRRTQGRIASLTNLIDRVCYLAIASGTETINSELIAATTIDNAAQVSSATA
ncbi:TniB family NTP-binding protein [Mycolicibacterium sp. CBMA 295]|uniref:TniB family NTP-binding protein n=1 Tax=Mycolicibacterium sp. CBMA 295 TaxID=2606605 RepID=UPI001EE4CD32|nr:TniB family NTP-binding protein [Mycolicibacterium sp. CBMA 295]